MGQGQRAVRSVSAETKKARPMRLSDELFFLGEEKDAIQKL